MNFGVAISAEQFTLLEFDFRGYLDLPCNADVLAPARADVLVAYRPEHVIRPFGAEVGVTVCQHDVGVRDHLVLLDPVEHDLEAGSSSTADFDLFPVAPVVSRWFALDRVVELDHSSTTKVVSFRFVKNTGKEVLSGRCFYSLDIYKGGPFGGSGG